MKNSNIDLYNTLLMPVSVSIITLVTEHIFQYILRKAKKKTDYPLLQTYLIENSVSREAWSEEISKSTYTYILSQRSRENIDETGLAAEYIFNKSTNSDCLSFINKYQSFVMIFYNTGNANRLEISHMKNEKNIVCFLKNQTKLSALNPGESFCIVCNIEDRPCLFTGSFKAIPISYKIEEVSTKEIYPTHYSKKQFY